MSNFEKNTQPQYLRDVARNVVQAITDVVLDENGTQLDSITISDEGIDNVAEIIGKHTEEQLHKIGMLLAPLLKSAVGELAAGVWEEALARSKIKG